uniref:Putative GMP synthase n=1 Tax=mine drainage metagenome TaxID=410659 RepID=E6QMX5_9ZZZZ
MAHELSFNFLTGAAEMAYVGEKPWHGYGQKLESGASIEDWANAASFNWKILSTPAMFSPEGSDLSPVPGSNVLYRSDAHTPLSIVSDRYQVVQPMEVLEFFRDLTNQMGFALETAGVLRGGRSFWAMARTGEDFEVVDGDKMAPYMLLATSCDGTMATTARLTTIRVVCANTLAMSANHTSSQFRYIHSTKFNEAECKRDLGLAQVEDTYKEFVTKAQVLAKRSIPLVEAGDVIKRIMLASDPQKVPRGFDTIMSLFQGAAKGSDMAGQTAWGMLNAVTEYVDHHARSRDDEGRMNSAWFGPGANMKERAVSILTELAAA